MNQTFHQLLQATLLGSSEQVKLAQEQGHSCAGCASVLVPPGVTHCPNCAPAAPQTSMTKVASADDLVKLAKAARYIAANIGDIIDDRSEAEKYLTLASQHRDILKVASDLDNPAVISAPKESDMQPEMQPVPAPTSSFMTAQRLIGLRPSEASAHNQQGMDRLFPQGAPGCTSDTNAVLSRVLPTFSKTAEDASAVVEKVEEAKDAMADAQEMINETLEDLTDEEMLLLAAKSARKYCTCQNAGTCKFCQLAALAEGTAEDPEVVEGEDAPQPGLGEGGGGEELEKTSEEASLSNFSPQEVDLLAAEAALKHCTCQRAGTCKFCQFAEAVKQGGAQ